MVRTRPAKAGAKKTGGEEREFSEKKVKYFEQANALFDENTKALVMLVDNVQSKQIQNIRIALRGKATVLMGKNTMIKKILLDRGGGEDASPQNRVLYQKLSPLLTGNVGLILTNADLKSVKDLVDQNKVQAPARQGAISPVDVIVPAGNTGLEPTKTSFFQALNIATKITKGTVEILKNEQVLSVGDKVGSSEATLLQMLKINPFFYGMQCQAVYDDGDVYSPQLLDITAEDMLKKMQPAASNITALSLALGYTTKASFPHVMMNSFKNMMALTLGIDYAFAKYSGEEIKEAILTGKSLGGGGGGGGGAAAVEEAPAAAAPPPEEEEDDEEMGFGLFD
eukprot:TRINITY_DN4251_c0_g1_i3.p1 TRINITY_DN4251_c0_g1~~TRINITY_DN4251_c0_g1_i3.p1  ORF type:complete len:339 (+),score=123.20 TRINITY_DN4251_c0_g1_i3:57-1073(+)